MPLEANRFLEMMAETTVGWQLLEGAAIAHEKREKNEKGDRVSITMSGKFLPYKTY